MNKISNYLFWVLLTVLLPAALSSCGSSGGDDEPPVDDFDIQFTLPSKIDIVKGGEYSFAVTNGVAPKTTDYFVMEGGAGVSILCPIVGTSDSQFTVRFPVEVVEGTYKVSIKRDQRRRQYGQMAVVIIKAVIKPDADATIYGQVSVGEEPLAGVVISDGVEVVTTNAEGIYQMKSAKKYGYVFMSIPSGYEAPSDGVVPRMFKNLTSSDAKAQERVDFTLTKVDGQDNYKVFFLGDMHLANRTGDASQFQQFTADLNSYTQSHYGEKMYAITLGDMTWDTYWYDNTYELADYLNTINKQVKDLQIFHTMGNHDNDFKATNDFDAEKRFVAHLLFIQHRKGALHSA